MLRLRQHDSVDYEKLPDIDAKGVAILTHDDQHCLDELGDYLVESDGHTRFGISLLHSHFPIADDEILIVQPHRPSRTVSLRPERRDDSDSNKKFVPLNMCFEEQRPDGDLRIIGLEYGMQDQYYSASLLDSDVPALSGLQRILSRNNAIRRFGVRLICDPFPLDGDEILLEFCDRSQRTLTCIAELRENVPSYRTVETFWRWEAVREAGTACISTSRCVQKCAHICLVDGDKHIPSRVGWHDREGGGHQSG